MSLPFLPTARLLWLGLGAAVPLFAATLVPGLELLAPVYLLGLLVAVAIDAHRAPHQRDLNVTRQHERRLSLGEPNPVDLHINWDEPAAADGTRPRRLWVRDEIPPGIPSDQPSFSGVIAPGSSWTGRYHLTPPRRGDYAFGAIAVRVEAPLGLLIWQHRFPAPEPARVYPNLRAVRRYDLLARRGRLQEVGLRRSRQFGSGTEFERLRDYLPDDDFRRINWKATARRHQPVTIEYETERSQNLIVLLDSGRLMGTPVGAMQKLDYAVNAALMLAYVAIEMDDRVGLLVFADRVERYVPAARGQRQFQLLLEHLYRVDTQPVEADPAGALNELARRQPKRSLVVLFTDLTEAAEPDALLQSLGLLARRHLPLCVMVSDPDITRLAAAMPGDTRTAYEKVVAQRLLDERHAVVERLERRGALVLDVSAELLTPGVINRYLEIKGKTLL